MLNLRSCAWGIALAAILTLTACKSDPPPAPTEPAKAPTSAPVATAPKTAPGEMKLTPEGQKFDPPIKPEALPDGAWYCDMGTVHYARSEKGDHTCPLCKMKLKEKVAAK